MSANPALEAAIEREKVFEAFENLMPYRVQDILLVSSLYDSFILREDGRLNELLIGESYELNLQHVPRITHVKTGAEALALARADARFNLIVTNLELEDMSAAELATEVKRSGLDASVVVLAYDYREVENFVARTPHSPIERIFLWQGNARILISIIKYIEDKMNVEHDTDAMNVPVMLVVEDNIRYYSSFLPVIYTELISQAQATDQRGAQCGAQVGAHACPAQDSAGFGFRVRCGARIALPPEPAGSGAGRGVPPTRPGDAGSRIRTGPANSQRRS